MSRSLLTAAAALALAVSAWTGAHAQAPGDIELRNVAELEQDVKTPEGKVEKRRVPATKAIPGNEVIYTSTFRNNGRKPAANVSLVNPVPANTTYVGGSASGENTDIVFSADGGRTWAPVEKLTVTGADGKKRPAAAADITHVRWTWRGDLAPGRQGAASFRVLVN